MHVSLGITLDVCQKIDLHGTTQGPQTLVRPVFTKTELDVLSFDIRIVIGIMIGFSIAI